MIEMLIGIVIINRDDDDKDTHTKLNEIDFFRNIFCLQSPPPNPPLPITFFPSGTPPFRSNASMLPRNGVMPIPAPIEIITLLDNKDCAGAL